MLDVGRKTGVMPPFANERLLPFGEVPGNKGEMLESGTTEGGPASGAGNAGQGKILVAGLGGTVVGDERLGNFAMAGSDCERESCCGE